jgi:hypothetical protein
MSTNQDNPTSTTEATSNVSSETATGTSASPQETTAAAPSSTAGEVPPQDAKADASGQRKTKAGKKPRHPKANGHSERSHRKSAGSENVAGLPPDMRERLLARFVVPSVPLDRNLLPEALLGPLDAAGLGRADLLPSSAFMTMASIAAVAGPHLTFAECADPKLGEKLGTGTSLRIVMVGDQHAGPIMPGAIMAAV